MKIIDSVYNAVLNADSIDNDDYKRYINTIDDCLDYLNETLSAHDYDMLTKLLYYYELCNDVEKQETFKKGIRFGAGIKEMI